MDSTLNSFVTSFSAITYEIGEVYESGIIVTLKLITKEGKILEYKDIINNFSELFRFSENKINKITKDVVSTTQNSIADAQLERAKERLKEKNSTQQTQKPKYDREELTKQQLSLGERKKRVFNVEEP